HGAAVEDQFRMADPAARLAQAELFLGAERLLVELDGPDRILHVKIREQLVDLHGILLSTPILPQSELRVLDKIDLVGSGTCSSEAGAAARYSLGEIPASSPNSRFKCGWSL